MVLDYESVTKIRGTAYCDVDGSGVIAGFYRRNVLSFI
jgi:hypothetical protein